MKSLLEEKGFSLENVSYVIEFEDLEELFIEQIKRDTGIEVDKDVLTITCDDESGKLLAFVDDNNQVYDKYNFDPEESFYFGDFLIQKIANCSNCDARSVAEYDCINHEAFPCEEIEIYIPFDYYFNYYKKKEEM